MNALTVIDYENVAGNAYDKYHSTNPIARRLMRGFLNSFDELVDEVRPSTSFEVGCGEGHLSGRLLRRGVDARGCDVDDRIVAQANELSGSAGAEPRFTLESVYDLAPGRIEADLIVCCEVLEHVPDPERALEVLGRQHATHWLLSVPREPIWRVLNLARGKYVADLGNTPGHIQHWSSAAFKACVSRHFRIVATKQPLPWTMLLCAPGN